MRNIGAQLPSSLIMNAVLLNEVKQDIEGLIARVLADAEPVVVETAGGEQVVVMPMDDFSSWQETIYLLRNPANAAHLRQSLAEAAQ
jgi:antitoxin YefM